MLLDGDGIKVILFFILFAFAYPIYGSIVAFIFKTKVKTRRTGMEIGHPDTIPNIAKFVAENINNSYEIYKKIKLKVGEVKLNRLVNTTDKIDKLKQLSELKRTNVISEEEFQILKAEVMGSKQSSVTPQLRSANIQTADDVIKTTETPTSNTDARKARTTAFAKAMESMKGTPGAPVLNESTPNSNITVAQEPPTPPNVEPPVLSIAPKEWVLKSEKINDICFGRTIYSEFIQQIGYPKETKKHSPFTRLVVYDKINFLSDTSGKIVGAIINTESNVKFEREEEYYNRTESLLFDKPTKLSELRMYFQWTIPVPNAAVFRMKNDIASFHFSGQNWNDETKHVIFQTTKEMVKDDLGQSLIVAIEFYTINNRLIPEP